MDILVIDNNALLRRAIRNYLANARYRVRESGDGKAVWDLLQQQQVQLIITTWPVPGVDGVDLLRRVRSERFAAYPYIILLADRTDDESLIEGMQAGADDYLINPVSLKQLRRRVVLGSRIQRLENQVRQVQSERDDLLNRDTLTGVLNRRSAYEHTALELARARREGKALGLILIDVDGLRRVNDRCGYEVGDRAIHRVSEIIARSIRHGDTIGRWGNAEFVVVLPETNLSAAASVAERVRARVEAIELPVADTTTLSLTISAGVTSTSQGVPALASALFHRAEQALMQAKERGRNMVVQFEEP